MSGENPVVAIEYKCKLCGTTEVECVPWGQKMFFSMSNKWCNCSRAFTPVMCEQRFIRKAEADEAAA